MFGSMQNMERVIEWTWHPTISALIGHNMSHIKHTNQPKLSTCNVSSTNKKFWPLFFFIMMAVIQFKKLLIQWFINYKKWKIIFKCFWNVLTWSFLPNSSSCFDNSINQGLVKGEKFVSEILTFRHGESTSTASQLTSPASQKSKDLNTVSLLLQDLGINNYYLKMECCVPTNLSMMLEPHFNIFHIFNNHNIFLGHPKFSVVCDSLSRTQFK